MGTTPHAQLLFSSSSSPPTHNQNLGRKVHEDIVFPWTYLARTHSSIFCVALFLLSSSLFSSLSSQVRSPFGRITSTNPYQRYTLGRFRISLSKITPVPTSHFSLSRSIISRNYVDVQALVPVAGPNPQPRRQVCESEEVGLRTGSHEAVEIAKVAQ